MTQRFDTVSNILSLEISPSSNFEANATDQNDVSVGVIKKESTIATNQINQITIKNFNDEIQFYQTTILLVQKRTFFPKILRKKKTKKHWNL